MSPGRYEYFRGSASLITFPLQPDFLAAHSPGAGDFRPGRLFRV
jgi:hypothetical protein